MTSRTSHLAKALLWAGALTASTTVIGCSNDESTLPSISARNRTSPALQTFGSCSELHSSLTSSLSEEMTVRLLQYDNNYYWGSPEAGGDDLATADGAGNEAAGGREEGVDFSGTNNQENGVDEADFVKTDGYHIYTLNGNRLEIFEVPEFGELEAASTTEFEGRPSQMLLGEDKLVVFSRIYAWSLPEDHPFRALVGTPDGDYGWWYYSSNFTKITVVDITDRNAPTVDKELYFEGNYQTARRVDSSVRMVNYAWMDIPGLRYYPELPNSYYELDYDDPARDAIWAVAVQQTIAANNSILAQTSLDDFLPRIYERTGASTFVPHNFTNSDCASFSAAQDAYSRGITSILSLDLLADEFTFDHDHIITNWSMVYASQDVLLIAEPAQDWWWYWDNDDFDEATNLHRFDISQAGTTTYTGSGRVDGTLRNQFSMSEHEGFVRVASTTGQWARWWMENPAEPENHVFVLSGNSSLNVVGQIDGIAVGEQIWSSRFVGDMGYLVTFRNIDPLWTIDLSNPTDPKILGELEIPGVSTYIHPLDGRLLTIGYGGDENGLDWATQVSLFDVSDPTTPSLDQALSLAPPSPDDGWTYAWSEATWEHKAFQYWGPKNMLAIPLSTYRYVQTQQQEGEETYYDYNYEYYSQLQLIKVDEESGSLSLYGSIDHSDFFNDDNEYWWSFRDVRRSIFMGEYIYAISDKGITVHHLDSVGLQTSLSLPGDADDPYWWW